MKVTPDGKVKVLDFGLAKAMDPPPGSASAADLARSPTLMNSPTMTAARERSSASSSARRPTCRPSRRRAAPVDRRADIWAFGVRALRDAHRRTAASPATRRHEVLAGVLKTEVSFAALPPETPPGVRRLLRRCLERGPKDRLRDIGDARLELGEALAGRAGEDAAAAPARANRARTLRRSAAAAALLLACGAIGFGAARMRAPRAAAPVDFHVLTSEEGYVYSARFASDGETIVYGQVKEGRPVALYSTRADATASRALDTPSADVVGISRSGTMALVLDRRYAGSWMRIGTLAQAELAGGTPRALLEGVYDADIAPDGATFAVVRGDGNEQRLEYPIGTVLHRTTGWISSPRISRDGRRVAFADHPIVGDDQGTVAVVEAGSPVRRLSEPVNFLHGVAWSADGREVVASFGTADEGAFLSAFAPGAPPRTLLRTISRTRLHDIAPSGAILLSSDAFSVSVEGRLAAGLPTLPFGSQTEALIGGISADGGTVVGIRGGRFAGGEYQAFSQRGGARPVSLGTGIAAGITPDGRRAFVYTLRRDQDKLRVVPIGPGDERTYDLAGVALQVSTYDPVSCAEDGRTVGFLGRRAGEEPRGCVLDLEGRQAAARGDPGAGPQRPDLAGRPAPRGRRRRLAARALRRRHRREELDSGRGRRRSRRRLVERQRRPLRLGPEAPRPGRAARPRHRPARARVRVAASRRDGGALWAAPRHDGRPLFPDAVPQRRQHARGREGSAMSRTASGPEGRMTLGAGARLGGYEITGPLGEGGMGVVYRATDSKLKRQVAIKVLPEDFARDPERLARFEREAQLLAQLQHPNIASIYGLEESGGVQALVLELVEGPTLAERLRHGPLPLDEALSVARQIAEAMEEAHEKGIVHRDLKPANVKVTPDGKVKVLDFGLAKAMDAPGPSSVVDVGRSPTLMNSPTMTAAPGTQLGVILGTAAYMSPEQARGRPVDKRADIWAFGVVLYEMLAGRRLFDGETVSDVARRRPAPRAGPRRPAGRPRRRPPARAAAAWSGTRSAASGTSARRGSSLEQRLRGGRSRSRRAVVAPTAVAALAAVLGAGTIGGVLAVRRGLATANDDVRRAAI